MPSSVVAHFEYNTDTKTLTVSFVSGKVYDYLHVPEKIYKEMRATISKGTYLNRRIKGKYPFEEIK
ncbi:KTSC domain-containing protein [Pedobacter sp. L105]|uniref:KTSC domain-containing protein n=1 Tax=Pedobacter sp. L105 TaxID=1641871 RepID=UPI00131B51EB|nr:KTSC domain-containing protein [Pedobacter sp. L105]